MLPVGNHALHDANERILIKPERWHGAFGLGDLSTLVTLKLAFIGSTGGRGWGFPFAAAVPGGE